MELLLAVFAICAFLFLVVGPFIMLDKVTMELNRSKHFVWWGLGGWFGGILALLWLIAVGKKEPGS